MTTTENVEQPRMLLVHRYVAPDIPAYGWMLPEIGKAAVNAGYDVEIFSTRPSYAQDAKLDWQPSRECRDGVKIIRIRLPLWQRGDLGKAVAGGWFAIRAFARVMFGKYDVVMAATTPPVVVARAVSMTARLRGSSFVYHCQDVHPEIAGGQGPFRWMVVMRFFRWLDWQTCHAAARIVVLSSDMCRSLVERREIDAGKVSIINNFLFREEANEQPAVLMQARELLETGKRRFRIVFSGNLGRFQGLDELLDGAALARPVRPIELIFVGSGNAEASLGRRAANAGIEVRFLGRQPKVLADSLVGVADLAVISLRPGLINYAYPSKTLDYLAAGTPILAIVEHESELARMLVERGFGVVASPGNREGIARAIEDAVDAHAKADLRDAMRALAKSEFEKGAVLRRWQELFESLKPQRTEA